MEIGQVIRFEDERFFDGAVQLSWVERRPERARAAAAAFVFHGPRYHGAAAAQQDGIDGNYRLKDTASFVRDLLGSMRTGLDGREANAFWLAVAGYGSGKSHLALTCAELLSNPGDPASGAILAQIERADAEVGAAVRQHFCLLEKPVLVLPLDGSTGFHLGNALSRAVFTQLRRHGIDAEAIRALSPRFQTAQAFVKRNFAVRAEGFAARLTGLDAEQITARLAENDEAVYSEVNDLYTEANGGPIPVEGQESAQALIDTLCNVYCGPDGPFSFVLILFDELGRYLEYAAEKPRLAGDNALQDIYQGVQDNSGKARFVGLIQYELKAYLKRFGGADLLHLQRYVTRYDTADKWYLSTNLETIFARLLGKDEAALDDLWKQSDADHLGRLSWKRMSVSLPGFGRFPVWSDADQFARVIARGCWPLHPLAVWFLTRQRDVLQSRSALTFIKDLIARIGTEDASPDGQLRRVSAAELVLRTRAEMLPELIAAERETGGSIAETLQMLLQRLQGHLAQPQELALAGIAVLAKLRIGKQTRAAADDLLCEATALDGDALRCALDALSRELGAVEWNEDLGQYELIADSTTRAVFQQWLRQQQGGFTADGIRDLFVRRGATDMNLGAIATDFAASREIGTPEWFFAPQLAHAHTCEAAIRTAFAQWADACLWNDPKGQVIYLYLHVDDDASAIGLRIQSCLEGELQRLGQPRAPIWVIGIADGGRLAEHIGRLRLFDEQIADGDRERFRRFIRDERERSLTALKEAGNDAIGERRFWIAGFDALPPGHRSAVGQAIFEQVYPNTVPFPLDGFGSSAGGGAADAAQLIRALIGRQLSGTWVTLQPRRLQNRVDELLMKSWEVLRPNGTLAEPAEPRVLHLYQWLMQAHQDDPQRTLLASYRALLAPPYGLNASSAGLLLGLVLGLDHPPRRILRDAERMPSADWVNRAFPSKKHQLDEALLGRSRIIFPSEDSAGRWRAFLEQWEAEQNFQKLVDLANEAQRLCADDPMPEALEGKYAYLRDRSDQARTQLLALRTRINEWERAIERAVTEGRVDHAIRRGFQVLEQRESLVDSVEWPQRYLRDCDTLLVFARELIARDVGAWIPQQSCNDGTIDRFRTDMERAVKALRALGFPAQANTLDARAHWAINEVERRRVVRLLIAESEEYPRQPDPTDSTPVRTLSDAITQGDKLIAAIHQADHILPANEIAARVGVILARQEKLREARSRRNDALGALQNAPPDGEEALREARVKANHLRQVFVETKNADAISEMVVQIERLLTDIAAWPAGDESPERLRELLDLQVGHQAAALSADLDAKDLEPAWADLAAIYRAVAQERIEAARRRSAAWLQPRLAPTEVIAAFDQPRCVELEQELMAAPSFLSDEDRARADALLAAVQRRRTLLEEQARRAAVATWQQGFPALSEIEDLGANDTERLLREIRTPPSELTQDEQERLAPIAARLVAHLDRLSLDELLQRISQLGRDQQRQLLERLSELLRSEAV